MRLSMQAGCVVATVLLGSGATLFGQTSKTGSSYGRETTFVEGYLNGQSELVKAHAAVVTAQAALIKSRADSVKAYTDAMETFQKARALAIDNDLKAVKTHYERKTLYEAYKATQTKEPLTKEQIARFGKAPQPRRLSSYQLDPARGLIRWPAALLAQEFSAARGELESLFAGRTPGDAGPGSEFVQNAEAATGALRDALRDKVQEMPSSEYMVARCFLDSLSYEARVPIQLEGLAKN